MRTSLLLVTLLFTAACEPYEEIEVQFAAYNTTENVGRPVVNGSPVGDIVSPGQPSSFTVTVRVPRESNRIIGSRDREAEVTVAFQNLTAGTMTEPEDCEAREGSVTSITYSVRSGRERVTCHS